MVSGLIHTIVWSKSSSDIEEGLPDGELAIEMLGRSANAHAMLGNTDDAIGWLKKAYSVRAFCMTDMKTDHRLDSLRTDQRFQALLRSLHFPE